MDDVTLIPKTSAEDNDTDIKTEDPVEELVKLDSSNIGFQLMAKLGWKGGSLGTRGDGIIDPVSAQLKNGNQGRGT
uniref:Uncharacterized protein n=1 Tax=Anopheles atroparvus TaxID=41427 RepID=A0A182J9N6_ANOAO